MDFYNKFIDYFKYSLEKGSLGLSVYEILLILASFLLALILRGFFAKIFISKLKKIILKTGNKVDDHLFEAMAPPLKVFPIILVFILLGLLIDSGSKLGLMFEKINQTLVTIFIFWFLHQFLVPFSKTLHKFEELLSKALFNWLIQSIKYLFIFLGIVAVLETWGIKIGPVIAGLGLFGVAVALGAQDLFKNLISGIMIIFEKRFKIDDVIEVPGHAIGTVEHIGFRSTLIRQFDSTPMSIPNYVFSDSSIINFSDRKYRRINWTIGLTYDTTANQLKSICDAIDKHIRFNNNFVVDDIYKLFVKVEKFNDSSIDILINAFTNTNDWEKFLITKEELAFTIKDIVEKNHSSFAFPSSSIYIEKNN